MSSRMCSGVLLGILFLAAAYAHASPRPPSISEKTADTARKMVRVLLGFEKKSVIQGNDLFINGQKFPGTSVFNVRCGSEEDSGASFVEYGAGHRSVGRMEISSNTGVLRLNEQTYRDRFSIIARGSSCMIVNVVELEKYLSGVIGKEMSPSWPLEALKAQAVAARSYALHQMRINSFREYDLENGIQDQVYEGVSGESVRTIQATEATKGETLLYRDEALKAYFHANCGGVTEVPGFVWGGETKAFRPVICPYHQSSRDKAQWNILVSRSQLESALRRVAGLLPNSFARVASLEAGAPNGSGRLSDVSVSDTAGNNILISTNTFRNAIGTLKLKSTAFRIFRDAKGFRIEGEGNGHGVGLCQVGAKAMAKQGKGYRQILHFYYPLAKILPLL